MRLSPLIVTFGAMLLAASPASYGASPNEDPAALTGIDTPESMALDKDAVKLVADRAKLIAEIKQRADKKQPVSDLQQQAQKLVQQVYEKAQAAADARARAAVDQRCVKASEAAESGDQNSAASPFLCAAVRTKAGTVGGNDPWTVCACVRRYLLGLKKEVDPLRAGRQGYVGKVAMEPGDSRPSPPQPLPPLTAEQVDGAFHMSETVDPEFVAKPDPKSGFATGGDYSLEDLAKGVQRQLAHERFEALMRGQSPPPRTLQDLLGTRGLSLPKHYAYIYLLRSLGLVWEAHRRDTILSRNTLQAAVDERAWAAMDASVAEQKALPTPADSATPDDALTIAIARRYDAMHYPFIVGAAQQLRPIVVSIRETRLRLKADTEAWNSFAANDGAGSGQEDFAGFIASAFMTPWDLVVTLPPWRADWARSAGNGEYAYLLPGHDSSDNYEGLRKDLQQRLPEIVLQHETPAPGLFLRHPINTQEPQLTEAVASGAGSTEEP